MLKVLNVVSITLLIAMVSVVLGTLVIRYVPAIFNPGLQGIAVAAWLSGIASWYVARQVAAQERHAEVAAEQGHNKGSSTLALTLVFLVVACGIGVGLHFYGGRLLDVVR